MFRKLLVLPVLALAVMAAPSQAQKKIQHPKMHAALYELRQARKVVSGLKDDLSGRKKKSLSAIDDAVRSVRLILAVGVDDPSPIRREKDFYKKWKDNSNIRAALEELREARYELETARSDFEGNKKQALRDIARAIDQLQDLLKALR